MPTRFKGKDATTGKYKYQWVSVKGTKKDAEKRLSELLHQLDTGTFIKPSKVTLASRIFWRDGLENTPGLTLLPEPLQDMLG